MKTFVIETTLRITQTVEAASRERAVVQAEDEAIEVAKSSFLDAEVTAVKSVTKHKD